MVTVHPSFKSSSPANLTPTAEMAIMVQGVSVTVSSGGERLDVLKDINLSIPKGMIQFLMGPSGSGKTTLLSVVGGLLTPTAGKVYLLGEEINSFTSSQLARFRLHNIGFVFQDFNLFPELTAVKNVEVALNLLGISGKTARSQALQLLERVGLLDQAKLKPRQLSGGQQQRVAIARALAGQPQLIMADEPTATLDSHSGRNVMDILSTLAREQGCTVLMVTHDPRIVDIADRIAYLEDGEINETMGKSKKELPYV
uniref:ABC transporter related n=1 Tax=Cyanothece sp. (strain PCC 7425 / ATCC 29141) TaxID=395961 RepID=B8HSP6_CYAP4